MVAISHRRISSGVEMERWRERGERSCVPLVVPLSWEDIVYIVEREKTVKTVRCPF